MTLAHIVRLVTLANGMHADGAEVCLATDSRYAGFVGGHPYRVLDLFTLSSERFSRAIATGRPIYDFETLTRYAREELALFARVKPDVVVGDFRLSLAVTARHAGIPYVNLANAYWSPEAVVRHIVPEYAWVSRLGVRLSSVLFLAFRKLGYALHAAPVDRLRRVYGLEPLGSDFRRHLIDGDATCFADCPTIVPVARLLPTQTFIGPVRWSPKVPRPAWWETFLRHDDPRPVVYVNLGSSGPCDVLGRVLDALGGMPLRVIAASVGYRGALRPPANARVAELLPGDDASAAARLVLCNGGSPSSYQALAQGAPVIGLATNMDQFLNMAAFEAAGCGFLVRSGAALAQVLPPLVDRALREQRLRERATGVGKELAAMSPVERFRQQVLRLAGRTPS